MFFIILGILLAFVFFWNKPPKQGWYDPADRWFAMFGTLIIGGTVTGTVCALIGFTVASQDADIKRNIYTLGDNAGVQGRFFLGSGSVETVPVYFYYSKNANGSYSLNHANASNVEIYEDVTTQPYVVKECDDLGPDPHSIWTWPVPLYSDGLRYTKCEVTEFHIPPNSIDNSYNLDAS